MLASSLAAALLQAPPTFDQIEEYKHKAYRAEKDFRESLTVELSADGRTQLWTITQRLQGPKMRVHVIVEGEKQVDIGHDGTKMFAIFHPKKEYTTVSGKNEAFHAKYERPDYKKAPEGDFTFNFQDGYNVRFMANPPFKVMSRSTIELQGSPARKIVANATIEQGKRYVNVTQYFFMDKWILRGFVIEGRGKNGPFKVVGSAETEFSASSTPGMFRLDPGLVKGYTLVKK
jgi:membrane-associated protease RseP (regulator of RpoE activity)